MLYQCCSPSSSNIVIEIIIILQLDLRGLQTILAHFTQACPTMPCILSSTVLPNALLVCVRMYICVMQEII